MIPATIQKSDTIHFHTTAPTVDGTALKASAGWTLTYSFLTKDNLYSIVCSADPASVDNFIGDVSATTTANYVAGVYAYVGKISKAGTAYTVEKGTLEIVEDYTKAVLEVRTHTKKMLDAIETLLEGKIPDDVSSYSIAGRNIQTFTIMELVQLRDRYKIEYEKELADEKIRRGITSSKNIKTRFI
jgi:hypothetical protein